MITDAGKARVLADAIMDDIDNEPEARVDMISTGRILFEARVHSDLHGVYAEALDAYLTRLARRRPTHHGRYEK